MLRTELIRSLRDIEDDHFRLVNLIAKNAGFDVDDESNDLLEWCYHHASEGMVEAQYVLSKLLFLGLYGERKEREGFEWCERAAQAGFAPALHMLSGYYVDGKNVPRNVDYAIELMNRAYAKGYVPALRSLGVLYLTGGFVRQDAVLGLKHIRSAAEDGDAYAQVFLGRHILESGDANDIREGVFWIEAAAGQNYRSAIRLLAEFYENGLYGLPIDLKKSKSLLNKIDQEGDAEG